MLAEDRKAEGVDPGAVGPGEHRAGRAARLSRAGIVSTARQDRIVEFFMTRLRIKASSPDQKVQDLSGGNQQKVLLARWMCLNPRVLLLDEPTRGIDVGAKAEVQTHRRSACRGRGRRAADLLRARRVDRGLGPGRGAAHRLGRGAPGGRGGHGAEPDARAGRGAAGGPGARWARWTRWIRWIRWIRSADRSASGCAPQAPVRPDSSRPSGTIGPSADPAARRGRPAGPARDPPAHARQAESPPAPRCTAPRFRAPAADRRAGAAGPHRPARLTAAAAAAAPPQQQLDGAAPGSAGTRRAAWPAARYPPGLLEDHPGGRPRRLGYGARRWPPRRGSSAPRPAAPPRPR